MTPVVGRGLQGLVVGESHDDDYGREGFTLSRYLRSPGCSCRVGVGVWYGMVWR